MREWHAASDLAGLPGLPGSERAIRIRADKQGWRTRNRKTNEGCGRPATEYHLSSLPEAARAELVRRSIGEPELPIETQSPAPAPDLTQLADWQRRIVEARLAILAEVDRLAPAMGLQEARTTVAGLAAGGQLPEGLQASVSDANARDGVGRTLSARTLRRWSAAMAEDGPAALAPRDGQRARAAPPPWLSEVLRYYLRPSKPSIAQAYEHWADSLPPPARIGLPNLRAVQRAISSLGAIARNRGRMGPREIKRLRVYTVRDFAGLDPTDVYSADGHCADFEVQHPQHGRPFRPEILTIIDIATRLVVGWSVGLAESAWLVADALRHACTASGIPAIWYVDLGSGFNNGHMLGPATGLLRRLGATSENSLPYNSQARGVIEHVHQTLWVRAGRSLPAFVGRDMDPEARKLVYKRGRREIAQTGRSRYVMPWADFLGWAQERVDRYNARPHASLGRRSPNDVWQAWRDRGGAPILPSEAEAADLFRPYERRRVVRGQVQLFGQSYYSIELETLDRHGTDVQVGYDIHDPEQVWVRDLDGRLLCIAELDANKAPYFPQSRVERARETRAAARLKRLENHADEVRAELGGGAPPRPEPEPLTDEQRANAAAVLARLAPAEPAPTDGDRPIFESDIQMYRWLLEHPAQATEADWDYIARAARESAALRLQMQLEDKKNNRKVAV